MTLQIESTSSDDTEKLGQLLGQKLRGGEVIELVSDLGGGKTTFTRGIAAGINSKDKVASPTFTLSKVYKSDSLTIHHFDFYRLPDAGLMEHEIADVLDDPTNVIIVEWGGVVQHALTEQRLTVRISHLDENKRQFIFEYPEHLDYLLEGLC